MEQEFINIGWFVATEYMDQELQEEPPTSPVLEKVLSKLVSSQIICMFLQKVQGYWIRSVTAAKKGLY